MNNKLVAIGIIVIFLVVGFSGCNQILPPDVKIIEQSAQSGFIGLDYTVFVNATLYNKGGDGDITVNAKLTQGNSEYTKEKQIYIESDETKYVTIEFKEMSFWSFEEGEYQVWVE